MLTGMETPRAINPLLDEHIENVDGLNTINSVASQRDGLN